MSTAAPGWLVLDLVPLATAVLAGLVCALPGNFLLLRRQSLLGDSIAHAVLPGLVVGLLATGGLAAPAMFAGAAAAALLAVLLIELLRRVCAVDPQAAMGVVFSVFFAAGIVLLEVAAVRRVDLDPECVLHGTLERLFWIPPATAAEWFSPAALATLPRPFVVLAIVAAALAALLACFFKIVALAAFDPAFARTAGWRPGLVNTLLSGAVAAAVVASFEAVGAILVVAMLIVPAAAARMLTDRLKTQVLASAAIAVLGSIVGYWAGAILPESLWGHSLSAAGSIVVVLGLLLGAAVLLAPEHGVLVRVRRRRAMAVRIAAEDLLGWFYRVEERLRRDRIDRPIEPALAPALRRRAEALGGRLGWWQGSEDAWRLTETGRRAGRRIIRSHRLWERYLVEDLGLRPDHVHDTAMVLEHLRGIEGEADLAEGDPALDPQGRPIPGE
jgi:manganese/zinc/iron transport system permease protein